MIQNILGIVGPKTYIPLVVIAITWCLEYVGVTVDEDTKMNITVLCGTIAAGLMRKGMVKEKEMQTEIEKRVDEKLEKIIEEKTKSILSNSV